MMGERKPDRKPIFPRLLVKYERNLRNRVQRGEIKEVTLNTYLNDANRVFEALVFAIERTDIEKAMKNYPNLTPSKSPSCIVICLTK